MDHSTDSAVVCSNVGLVYKLLLPSGLLAIDSNKCYSKGSAFLNAQNYLSWAYDELASLIVPQSRIELAQRLPEYPDMGLNRFDLSSSIYCFA